MSQQDCDLLSLVLHSAGLLSRADIAGALGRYSAGFDPWRAISLLQYHRVLSIVYKATRETSFFSQMPGKCQIILSRNYGACRFLFNTFEDASCKISSSLTTAGIAHCFIKGTSTLRHLGWDPGVKDINDIDLLVTPDSLDDTIICLRSLGYCYGEFDLAKHCIRQEQLENTRPYRESPHTYHHLRWPMVRLSNSLTGEGIPNSVPIRVELHVAVGWRNMPTEAISTSDILNRSVPLRAENGVYLAQSLRDLETILCLQNFHDLTATWDLAIRNKDADLSRIIEIGAAHALLDKLEISKDVPSQLVTHARNECIALLDELRLAVGSPNRLCPARFLSFGLSSDSLAGKLPTCTVVQRFLDPYWRVQCFTPPEIASESTKRAGFWRNDGEGDSIHSIRSLLWAHTARYVSRHVPWYSTKIDLNKTPTEVYHSLPSISKSTVASHWRAFVSEGTKTDSWATTYTGTTTGAPLLLVRPWPRVPDSSETHEYTLHIHTANHGESPRTPDPFTLSIPLQYRAHFQSAVSLLCDGGEFPAGNRKIRTLFSGLAALKRLACFIEENFSPNIAFHLDTIYCSGTHLTRTSQARLEQIFGCRVIPLYGLSEFSVGVARKCDQCNAYHFPVSVLPDAVPVFESSSLCEMYITHLFPFTTTQFFVKYQTGDLVLTVAPKCVLADRGYVFIGRRRDTFVSPCHGGIQCLSPIMVGEVLESLGYSAYLPTTDHFKGILRAVNFGCPVFEMKITSGGVKLVILRQRGTAVDVVRFLDSLGEHVRSFGFVMPATDATFVDEWPMEATCARY